MKLLVGFLFVWHCNVDGFLHDYLTLSSALVYWDLPFGLGVADWDAKAFDEKDFCELFHQLLIICTKASFAIAFHSLDPGGAH